MDAPAESLLGLSLKNGWVVFERAPIFADATGAAFSVGYRVRSKEDGRTAFLKALNIKKILGGADDTMSALEDAVRIFNFERDVCVRCQTMNHVVTILESDAIRVDPDDPFTLVPYLIFEEAQGDVRAYIEIANSIDFAWALRCLHQIANGLSQLHAADIAHQDLKPSNVLVFQRGGTTKVADLGRAAQRSAVGPYDRNRFAGSRVYAPPELLYGQIAEEWNERRLACDMYLLGSMLTFFVAHTSMTALLLSYLDQSARPKSIGGDWAGDYASALPLVQEAFSYALAAFSGSVPSGLEDLTAILRRLCDPDPKRRGHEGTRAKKHGNPFALDFFVSRFDALARRAEAKVGLGI